MKYPKAATPEGKLAILKAVDLRLRGLTYKEIGEQMGFSRQRAQQLVRPSHHVYRHIRARAGNACEDCHITLKSGHLHHKSLPDYEGFNDLDNLEYLCASCHRKKHV